MLHVRTLLLYSSYAAAASREPGEVAALAKERKVAKNMRTLVPCNYSHLLHLSVDKRLPQVSGKEITPCNG